MRSGQPWEQEQWLPAFFRAIEREAADGLDLLFAMERAWFTARRAIAGRRKDSHDAAAVDVLAAAPVLSATTLARILGIAVKNAIRILDVLATAEIAIEVDASRETAAVCPSGLDSAAARGPAALPPGRKPRPWPAAPRDRARMCRKKRRRRCRPLTPIERRAFDYTALEEAMAHLDAVVRQTRNNLGALLRADGG